MLGKFRFALVALVFFPILATVSSAASVFQNVYCATTSSTSSFTSNVGTCIQNALPYVFIALLLSFTMVILSYLLGEVLNIRNFKGWYKAELWEALKSLIIVGAVISAILILGEVAYLLPGAPQTIPLGSITGFDYLYDTAYSYFIGPAAWTGSGYAVPTAYQTTYGALNLTNDSYTMLLGVSMGKEMLQFFRLNTYFTIPLPPAAPPSVPVYGSINVGLDYNPAFETALLDTSITAGSNIETNTLYFLIVPMLLALGAQTYLFTTLIVIALGILLPLGLIFRATPFLRNIGGTLIAIAIVMIIVYPELLAFFNEPMNLYFSPLYAEVNPPAVSTNACGQFIDCAPLEIYAAIPQTIFTVAGAQVPQAWLDGFNGAQGAFADSNLGDLLTPFFDYVVPVVVQFILLIIDLILGIVIAQQLAKALGGKIRLGIGSIKLT
jgi:hypothetical protein